MKSPKLKVQNAKLMKIGLIGCGAIGSEIARAIDKSFKTSAALIAISDVDDKKAKLVRKTLRKKPAILKIDELIKRADLIIEAASAKISGQIARKAVLAKKDVLIMSVGGIIRDYAEIFAMTEKTGSRVYLPSGAICGLDGVKAASLGKISRAELITRKPPVALAGAPFITKNNIDLTKIKTEKKIFSGTAEEAIKGFPANINVSCALSLAGIGPQKTKVTIIASPKYTRNIHEVLVEGEFGKLATRTENVPSPRNSKTSYLAVLSAIAMLKQILSPVKVGT